MKIFETKELTAAQKKHVVEMWNNEYPANIAYSDVSGFDEYLNGFHTKRHFLAIDENGEIVGWALIFDRDDVLWFAIIIDGKAQGKGLGVKLIETLQSAEKRLFGWVIDNDESVKSNGEKYRSPLGFYRKLGFKVHHHEKYLKGGISGVKIEWHDDKS
ncbi:MAG TPA: GNAT family N-acetyltransferase [Pyrinomonadaceae bacterium]|nr:GNAT family N-acetyltransferase [Pyrinomonadaceae bacterium]